MTPGTSTKEQVAQRAQAKLLTGRLPPRRHANQLGHPDIALVDAKFERFPWASTASFWACVKKVSTDE
jgi:hypothetical protein